MMCLGWRNQSTCMARPNIDALTGQPVVSTTAAGVVKAPSGANLVTACPDITWFWVALAGVVSLSMANKG